MSILHRNGNRAAAAAEVPVVPTGPPSTTSAPAAHSRASAAWFGICVAAFIFVVLLVFMLQNTSSVEVSFLWLHGSLPLALALLIAGVGVGIVATVIGTIRIAQLRRRLSRQQR